MTRDEFMTHIRSGRPATEAVFNITGLNPYIITIADTEDRSQYTRYGIMMAGNAMAALVVLSLDTWQIPGALMERIRDGEPAGAVLVGMKRRGWVTPYPRAIRSRAALIYNAGHIGHADEIFTESLFR